MKARHASVGARSAHVQPCRIAAPRASHLRYSRQPFSDSSASKGRVINRDASFKDCNIQHWSQPQQVAAHRATGVVAMAGATPPTGQDANKTSVLFVCLGNICRSPSAEAVFKAVVEREGVADRFFIDSCGTGGGSSNWFRENGFSYHEGDKADSRMRAAAQRRDMHLTSISRPLTPDDLNKFDYIIGMDDMNLEAIRRAAGYWGEKHQISDFEGKTSKMTQYLRSDKFKSKYNEVPDPYFEDAGKTDGFHLVLDLLEDACEGLLHVTGVKAEAQA